MALSVSVNALAVLRSWAEGPAQKCPALCLIDVDCEFIDDCGAL